MTTKNCAPGELLIEVGQPIEYVHKLVKGKLELKWKWTSWKPLLLTPDFYIGLVEHISKEGAIYSVQAVVESEIELIEPETLLFTSSKEVSQSILNSLGQIYEKVLFQRLIGVEMSAAEIMYQAFDTFSKSGNEANAIESYSRFMVQYPNSKYVDEMLKIIQEIFTDKTEDTPIPENPNTAFDFIQENLKPNEPNENILLLKSYEKKFPNSEKITSILSIMINEYDKLGDEYQLNFYTRKLIYYDPDSDAAKDALYYLIHLQRKNGHPEWYENVIRFLLKFDDEEQCAQLKKYINLE
ncbi:MAG: hypothetical protein PWQ84_1241 [Thermotogaceae bacterium]|jgi:outer membrane protein assembly factor BamD (BamD/ComL family)|nr:hypothetical protein [Thermotogaceae bacterium]